MKILYFTNKMNDLYSNEKNDHDSHEEKKKIFLKLKLCGIKNYGTNCYLNSGLQIISKCEKFIHWLLKNNFPQELIFCNLLKNTCNMILNSHFYHPKDFMDYFCSKNLDFIKNAQNCSQSFIRAVLSNINKEILDYNKNYHNKILEVFNDIDQYQPNEKEKSAYKIFKNQFFPKSYPYSLFSGIIRTESKGSCDQCKEKISKFSFSNFIDYHIYLDTIQIDTSFKKVLHENLGEPIQVSSYCPNCHNRIILEDTSIIIKCPDILIFTLERYFGPINTTPIDADEEIDLKNYIDKSMLFNKDTRYELFAINVRFGQSSRYGHQICQIKKDLNWYKLDDDKIPEITPLNEYNKNSYGLFYKKKSY